MPRHKQTEGGTAVLEPKARALTIHETLALACKLEDLAEDLARMRSEGARKLAARVRALAEDLEDRADVAAIREAREEMRRTGQKPIPFEDVAKKLGL